MTRHPRPAARQPAQGFLLANKSEIGSPEDRRAVLLDCATRLQAWPMANRVYRERLDSVALELIRLAGTVGQDGSMRADP